MAKITETEGHEHLSHVPANVWAAFFILMSLTTTIGFICSWILNDALFPAALFLAALFNIVATLIKYRIKEKNVLGEISLGASLVADLHLIPACVLVLQIVLVTGKFFVEIPVAHDFAAVGAVGFALGAVVANMVSVAIVVINESLQFEYLRKYKRVRAK